MPRPGVRVDVGTTRGTLNIVIVAWRLARLHVGIKVVPEQLKVTLLGARSPCAFSCADRATAMCHWVKAPAWPIPFARRISVRLSARYSCAFIPIWKLTGSFVYPLAVGRLPWRRRLVFRPPRNFRIPSLPALPFRPSVSTWKNHRLAVLMNKLWNHHTLRRKISSHSSDTQGAIRKSPHPVTAI
jgi:hypothetical protein